MFFFNFKFYLLLKLDSSLTQLDHSFPCLPTPPRRPSPPISLRSAPPLLSSSEKSRPPRDDNQIEWKVKALIRGVDKATRQEEESLKSKGKSQIHKLPLLGSHKTAT